MKAGRWPYRRGGRGEREWQEMGREMTAERGMKTLSNSHSDPRVAAGKNIVPPICHLITGRRAHPCSV